MRAIRLEWTIFHKLKKHLAAQYNILFCFIADIQ